MSASRRARTSSATVALAAAACLVGCPTDEPPPEPDPVEWAEAFEPAPLPDLMDCAVQPDYVAGGDLDGDGAIDLAINDAGAHICLLRGLGDGTFEAGAVLTDDVGHNALALGDVDGDGRLDVLAGNIEGSDLPIHLNAGGFAFAPPVRHAAGDGPFIPVVARLDGDGLPDVAVINAVSNDLSVLRGDPGGGLLPELRLDGLGLEPSGLDAADLDGDGHLDLVHSNFSSDDVTVHWGDGAGGFADTSLGPVGALPATSRAGDLDGDGDLDLATANEAGGDVTLLYNVGGRDFTPVSLPLGHRPFFIAPADLDGRGVDELVVPIEGEGWVAILAADAEGSMEVVAELATGGEPAAASTADLDGDGRADVLVTNWATGELHLFLNVLE